MLGFILLTAILATLWLRRRHAGTALEATALPSLHATAFTVDLGAVVRHGPPLAYVIRFLRPVSFVPYVIEAAGTAAAQPRPLQIWAQRLGAPLVLNGGQFAAQLQYIGWLKGQGQWLSAERQPAWMGLLVSAPLQPGAPWAQIVDLALPPRSEADTQALAVAHLHVVQSMMLLDEAGEVRVRHTDQAACRTIVAQDRQGRLLILVTQGAVSLYDLATWLRGSALQVTRAMNLDGGLESQLLLNTPELKIAHYGQYANTSTLLAAHPSLRVPLPTVIAVWPQPG